MAPPSPALIARLDALDRSTDHAARLARDPLGLVWRTDDPVDAEISAIVASQLAFGRVDLFLPVIARVLDATRDDGGPAAFTRRFDDARAARLADASYRWNRPDDFVALFHTLRAVLERFDGVGSLFRPGPARESLGGAIDALRALAPADVSRGFRTWLAHPAEGSACKRWSMLMRWMVRRDAPDLGVWTHLSAGDLVYPMDTHVFRIATFLGLISRKTADWRAAEDLTSAMRHAAPDDPVRYDFALAQLGISGACRGARVPDVCAACPLDGACAAPELNPTAGATPAADVPLPTSRRTARRGTAS